MQQITAGAASEKITELKSKLAVYAAWLEILRSSYLPCDAGLPEVRIYREDGGLVSKAHLTATIAEINQKCTELAEELVEWEGLVFSPIGDVVRAVRAVPDATPAIKKVERAKVHGRRLQPAPAK